MVLVTAETNMIDFLRRFSCVRVKSGRRLMSTGMGVKIWGRRRTLRSLFQAGIGALLWRCSLARMVKPYGMADILEKSCGDHFK